MNPMVLVDDARAALRTRVTRLTRHFDARPRRERVALLLAACALSYWLADKLWLTPAFERSRAATVRLAAARSEHDTAQAELARLQALGAGQRQQLQAETAQVRERVSAGAAALRAYENTLVGADRMVGLLEQMLPRQGGVKVRELRSLGQTDLLQPADAKPGAPAAPAAGGALYRHGVELTIEGSWPELIGYLQALERMPRRVLWGGLTMKVDQYPTVVLTLRIYTLSLDRGWLEI